MIRSSWLRRNMPPFRRKPRLQTLGVSGGFNLSAEQRRRLAALTGREPETSLELLLEQIRNGRRLLL